MSAGDIAFRFIDFVRNMKSVSDSDTAVTVCDINQAMLDVGKRRAAVHGRSQSLLCYLLTARCLL